MPFHNNFRARRINVNTYWENSRNLCGNPSDYEEQSTGNAQFTCSEVFFSSTNVSRRARTKHTLISDLWVRLVKCIQSVAHEGKSRWIERRLNNFLHHVLTFHGSKLLRTKEERGVRDGKENTKWKFIDPSGNVFVFFSFTRSRKAGEAHGAMARCIITMGRFLRLQHNYRYCVKFSTRFFIASMFADVR